MFNTLLEHVLETIMSENDRQILPMWWIDLPEESGCHYLCFMRWAAKVLLR